MLLGPNGVDMSPIISCLCIAKRSPRPRFYSWYSISAHFIQMWLCLFWSVLTVLSLALVIAALIHSYFSASVYECSLFIIMWPAGDRLHPFQKSAWVLLWRYRQIWGSCGLMVRESDSYSKGFVSFESRAGRICGGGGVKGGECTVHSHPQYHDWAALEQGTEPSTAHRVPAA